MSGAIVPDTVSAIRAEILRSPWRGRPAKTIFFGGGTPTFLGEDLCHLLEAVLEVHPPVGGCEVTSEANPGTVSRSLFRSMRSAGFGRLSLGAQSFDPGDLRRLGRVHSGVDVGSAMDAARAEGFSNVNLDFMFGLPGQSQKAWARNLDLAISLAPEHLSLYSLTIEANTRFYRLAAKGRLDLPEEERQVALYDYARERVELAGFRGYEISNYAKPGYECRHNLATWHGEEYLAYGPGAVGVFEQDSSRRVRYTNWKHPRRYVEAIASGADLWCERETLDAETMRFERVMLGLRLDEGCLLLDVDSKGLNLALQKGWVEVLGSRVRLTPNGRHWHTDAAALLA